MLRRSASAPESAPVAPEQQPQPRPRRSAAEARAFEPSTFASRKADAEQLREALGAGELPDLVRVGRTEKWLKDRRGKDLWAEGTLYHERNRPMRMYVRLDYDGALYPLFDDAARPDEIEAMAPIRTSERFASRHQPSGREETRIP